MISFLLSAISQFIAVPALVGFIGLWFVLGCFRLLWWIFGGVENGRLS